MSNLLGLPHADGLSFAALLAFVAGVLALVWAWEWDGPEWLAIPGWLAAVVGGAGLLIAVIPWLWGVTV